MESDVTMLLTVPAFASCSPFEHPAAKNASIAVVTTRNDFTLNLLREKPRGPEARIETRGGGRVRTADIDLRSTKHVLAC